jgi:hypothetical protein
MYIHYAQDWVVVHVAAARVDVLRRRDALSCLVSEHMSNGASPMDLMFGTLVLKLAVDHDPPTQVN